MYEQRFGMNRKPFQSVLTNVDFFESNAYNELSDSVLHALRSDLGVAVLTGPSGIGKTVTLDSFRRALDKDGQAMVLRGGTIQTASDLLQSLHRRLIPPPASSTAGQRTPDSSGLKRWEVLERMQRVADFWGPTIILLDDAHLASTEVFSELRTLLEEEADGHRLVRLLIAGPISLEETLAEPVMADFAQRIRAHEFLQPFTSTESVAYLEHQIARVGGDAHDIFDSKAIERIVAAADGVPRCIDLLADESLMGANKAESSVVSLSHVNEALSRLRHLPHSWNVSLFNSDEEAMDLDEDEFASDSVAETTVVETTPSTAATFVRDTPPSTVCGNAASRNSNTVSTVASGFIEIGAPAASTDTVSQTVSSTQPKDVATALDATQGHGSQARRSNVRITSPGVIEIGADIQPPLGNREPAAVAPETPQQKPEQSADSVVEIVEVSDVNIDDSQSLEEDIAETVGVEISAEEFEKEVREDIQPAAPAEEFQASDHIVNEQNKVAPTSPEPTISKPVDFDKAFGAVEFAGHGVTMTQKVVDAKPVGSAEQPTGKSPQKDTGTEGTGEDSVSLEHHMVLAHSTESHEEIGTAIADADVQLESESDVATATATDDAESSLSNFTPWQPAGSWDEVSMPPRRLFKSSSSANSSPVFDRFTWCELGRSVSSDPVRRIDTTVTHSESAVWPPIVEGIAPTADIPMLPFDEDYTDLLSDLGMLVESTPNTLGDRNQAAPTVPNANQTIATDDVRSPATVDPNQWIDRIDQLIDSEADPVDLKADDAGPEASDTVDVNSAAESTGSADGQRLFTLPIDIHEVDFTPPLPPASDPTGQAHTESDPSDIPDGQAELQHLEIAHQKDQILDCGDEQSDGVEQQSQQCYTPRLLAQARSRIVNVGTSVGGLKKAAGAESLSSSDELCREDSVTTRLEIHVSNESHGDSQPPEAGSAFSNLFTRLRQLRKR